MNVFQKIPLLFSAYQTKKYNRFYTDDSAPDLRIAPYAVNAIVRYNDDTGTILQKKRYVIYRGNARGKLRPSFVTLSIGMEKSRKSIDQLRIRIKEKERAAEDWRMQLTEERFGYQASQAPHLVQHCNIRVRQFNARHAEEMLELKSQIIDIISKQLEALKEAERLVGCRLNKCMDEINTFYASYPSDDRQGEMKIPTIYQLKELLPFRTFPDVYTAYMKELEELRKQYL